MTADYKTLLKTLKDSTYAPAYLIDGDEPFYLDRITDAFEAILPPHERDFNLLVLYGREAHWADVLNACRRFPMFAERQVVILKDAAALKGLEELAAYVQAPSPTTIFLIEHRFKKADGRGKLAKVFADKKSPVLYFTSGRIKDEEVPGWVRSYGADIGLPVGPDEAETIATHLGADLQKIANELDKVRIAEPGMTALTPEAIRRYIGASKEYNIFKFADTLTTPGLVAERYRMVAYFTANPKTIPTPLVAGALYNHFSRLYAALGSDGKDAAAVGVPPFRLKDTVAQARRIGPHRLEACLLAVADYSAAGVGVESYLKDAPLLRELVAKVEAAMG